jgi:hypothetical protein
MKHPSSRQLYAYWEEQRGKRLAPERADIEPGPIRQLLGDSFILALDAPGGHPFRLAGTRVCALFGREMKDETFIQIWSTASRPVMTGIMEVVAEESIGVVASVHAHNTAGDPIELELLLLPLSPRRPVNARAIGILAPLVTPEWVGVRPLASLTLGNRRHIGPVVDAVAPRFMAARGRARRGFVVYDGGRTNLPK